MCGYTEHGKDRAYYDFKSKQEITSMGLTLVSGYKASMDIYGERILLCSELSHKLINMTTCWDAMKANEYYRRDKALWREYCLREFVGETILTTYNNKSYHIDDIDFDTNPTSTFELKGEKISYMDYFGSRYHKIVRDREQCMFVCLLKIKQQKKGEEKIMRALLVPEFCYRIGSFFKLFLS